jgi:hypothetical protein
VSQSSLEAYVLVDLSQTWHAESFRERNLRALEEVGQGVVLAADALDPPIGIQYRIIGAESLERPPTCEAVYAPSMVKVRGDSRYEVKSRPDLRSLLTVDCPERLLALPAEPMTEISGAINSVANQPAEASRRAIVILSDLLEESRAPQALPGDLSGFRILLLYRPVQQDAGNAAALSGRVDHWRNQLAQRGAQVQAIPDTGIRRTTIANFLLREGADERR